MYVKMRGLYFNLFLQTFFILMKENACLKCNIYEALQEHKEKSHGIQ